MGWVIAAISLFSFSTSAIYKIRQNPELSTFFFFAQATFTFSNLTANVFITENFIATFMNYKCVHFNYVMYCNFFQLSLFKVQNIHPPKRSIADTSDENRGGDNLPSTNGVVRFISIYIFYCIVCFLPINNHVVDW